MLAVKPEWSDKDLYWSAMRADILHNYESARHQLRAALEISLRDQSILWPSICSSLAWLEEDPELAAALFENSFLESDTSRLPGRMLNALLYAILTDSEDLAQDYYVRWEVLMRDAPKRNDFFEYAPDKIKEWYDAREAAEASQE